MPDTTHPETSVKLAHPVRGAHPRLLVHQRDETISKFLRAFRVWQRQITAFLVSQLNEGDVFVDVGANIGYFTVYAGLCVGRSGRVHAMEPDDDNALLLEANLALNKITNVKVNRIAISDEPGEVTLYRGGFNAGAHSLLPKPDLASGAQVKVTTLDDLLRQEVTPKLIKIDVQGLEMQVLAGMKELLSRSGSKPGIVLEFSPVDLARSDQLDRFFEFVEVHNYSLRAFISNPRMVVTPPQIRRSTLRAIAADLIEVNDAAEFDLALLPRT